MIVMLLKLKEHPHCNNCKHLQKKKKHFHCKGHWKDKVHPEHAGHVHEKLSETTSVYHVNCHSYSPKKHVKE
ncbi:MAG: hypothetical protein KKG59_04590 [Nanoarchaeota archaeon]|nr:hypothetical protein [Nanoarchaeota archaeon]